MNCRNVGYNITFIYMSAITCMLYVITRFSYIVFNYLQNIKKHVYSHVQIACLLCLSNELAVPLTTFCVFRYEFLLINNRLESNSLVSYVI